MTTFGVEEEYFLIDPHTLRPVGAADVVLDELGPETTETGLVTHEFLTSQVERSTPVFTDLDEAAADLARFRGRLASAARSHAVLAVATGTPFDAEAVTGVTRSSRYQQIRAGLGDMVRDHQICATHVHVGVPGREAGVQALNHVRVWLPTLLSISGNSPFWRGRDTGFESWRAVIMRRWATTGCPPAFTDAADYDRRLRRLVGVAGTVDTATVAWYARLSERYPTLEVRVADAQIDPGSAVLLAALVRALVVTGLADADRGVPPPELEPELLDASLFHASRDGVGGRLLHPVTRELAPARTVVDGLLRHVDDALSIAGDRLRVAALLDRLWVSGTGAQAQRRALQSGGLAGLRELYDPARA